MGQFRIFNRKGRCLEPGLDAGYYGPRVTDGSLWRLTLPNELASRTGTSWPGWGWLALVLLAALAMLVQGYHPGLEDDAFYLAAIKQDLNPSLFPHGADFFRVQFQATVFDKLIAFSLRWTHVPLEWGILFWQWAVTVLILWGCWRISRRCFVEAHAQWAAVTLVAVLLTLPVSGTALFLTDQHLHARALATALILAAIAAAIDGRRLLVGALLAAAFSVHGIMAAFGASYCLFLMWKPAEWMETEQRHTAVWAALLWPLGWIFEPTSDAWRQAAAMHTYFFLLRWHWYEWLGVVAPPVLLWWFQALAQRRRSAVLARVAKRLVYFGVFQLAVALVILWPAQLDRFRSFEPMRFLHLVYLLFVLLSGGLLGRYVLKKHALHWLLLFVPLGAGMFYAQRQMYPATAHLELPGAASRNSWVEAFRWISRNTPVDSQFALDPRYMEVPGEDYHGFRALAERSVLADALKDSGMATRVPSLAPRWVREVEAQRGWRGFKRPDFLRLKEEFGVDWVVLQAPGVEGLPCPYRNPQVVVCRVE